MIEGSDSAVMTVDEREKDVIGIMTPAISTVEPGSFRDRNGRIIYHNGSVLRGISAQSLRDWQALTATDFFQRSVDRGDLIETRRLNPSDIGEIGDLEEWAAVLEHERIPYVSYPYEWSFGMLKDAALLHLQLLIDAIDEDMTLKDGTAYNVQWRGTRPVFIDIPSFERLDRGEPWVGYRQFCELFLYPLMLQAHLDVPFQSWLRGRLDGIPVEDMSHLLTARHVLRAGVFKHVYLQGKMQSRYSDTDKDLKSELRQANFSKQLVRNNAANLSSTIRKLTWDAAKSEWSDYAGDNSYTDQDQGRKAEFVRSAVTQNHRRLTWDLGCNTGKFSRIAAENSDHVVAMDSDHLSVEHLYQTFKSDGVSNILPLCVNLADPSPSLGWRLLERKTLTQRAKPDLTLCLALIHHMVISANVPMNEFISWLASLDSDLVIEFVTREDPMVRKLLRNRDDQYSDYNLASFEECLERHFNIDTREWLVSGSRVLYYARPR